MFKALIVSALVAFSPAWAQNRPSIKISEVLKILDEDGRAPVLVDALETQLAQLISDEDLRKQVVGQLRAMIASKNYEAANRMLTFKLLEIAAIQAAADNSGLLVRDQPTKSDLKSGSFSDLLEKVDEPAVDAKPMIEAIPEMTYGHAANTKLKKNEAAMSIALAKVLTRLAEGNDFFVRVGPGLAGEIRTPRKLLEYLLAHGHKITVQGETTSANFLSFLWKDKDGTVRDGQWPVWIDTGSKVKGVPIVVPMGHSQYSWYVSGPRINARVSFFLGVSGAGFFPFIDIRPTWTGFKIIEGTQSSSPHEVSTSVSAATRYLQFNRIEGAGLKNDGYGLLGVCNDSTAVVLAGTSHDPLVFPIVRNKEALNSGDWAVADIINKLPKDVLEESDFSKRLRRIKAASPYRKTDNFFDAEFGRVLEVLNPPK